MWRVRGWLGWPLARGLGLRRIGYDYRAQGFGGFLGRRGPRRRLVLRRRRLILLVLLNLQGPYCARLQRLGWSQVGRRHLDFLLALASLEAQRAHAPEEFQIN